MPSQRSTGSCISSRTGEQQSPAPPRANARVMGAFLPGAGGTEGFASSGLSGQPAFPTRKYWTRSSFWKSGIQGAFSTADTWPGLPAVIDAAFQDVLTKRVFFFSGERCPCLGPAAASLTRCCPGAPGLTDAPAPCHRSAVLGVFWQEHAGPPRDREAGHREGSQPHLGGPAAGTWQSAAVQRGALLAVSGSHRCHQFPAAAGVGGSPQPSLWLCSPRRLDVKIQRVDKGYPRATDDFFTGVPLDARNVFLYQGEQRPVGMGGPCCHPLCCPEPPTGWAPPPPRLGASQGLHQPECWPQGASWLWGAPGVPAVRPLGQGPGPGVPCATREAARTCPRPGCLPTNPPPLPSSSPRQVPLLPGQLLLEDDSALPGGPRGLRQVRPPAVPPALGARAAAPGAVLPAQRPQSPGPGSPSPDPCGPGVPGGGRGAAPAVP